MARQGERNTVCPKSRWDDCMRRGLTSMFGLRCFGAGSVLDAVLELDVLSKGQETC